MKLRVHVEEVIVMSVIEFAKDFKGWARNLAHKGREKIKSAAEKSKNLLRGKRAW